MLSLNNSSPCTVHTQEVRLSRHDEYLGWHRTENNERPATPRSSPSCGTEKLPTRAADARGYGVCAGAPGSTAAMPSGLMLNAKKVNGSLPGFPHWWTRSNGS